MQEPYTPPKPYNAAEATVARSRRGRPPAHEAGRAEERVLEAATALFFEQGFGRTTIDQVAANAGVGKSSLYGRYPDKEALFTAVVHHSIKTMFAELPAVLEGVDTETRLRQLGVSLADNVLVPRCIAFMRITAAEAKSLPELARSAYDVSFSGTVRRIREVLDDDPRLHGSDTDVIARRFVEVAFQPISFQAAYGSDVDALRARSASDVDDAILLLKAKGLLPL